MYRAHLSELVYSKLKLEDEYVKRALTNYTAEHLGALGENRRNGLLVEEVEKYLEEVFQNAGFLEYEVYAVLLRHGAPALPRLKFSYTDPEDGKRVDGEIDVATVVDNELWLMEVTSSQNEKELSEKAKKLSNHARNLGAEGALLVCTKRARELAEQLGISGEVEFVSFEGLYSELHRLAA